MIYDTKHDQFHSGFSPKIIFWGKFWADLGSISLAKLIISNFCILNCRTMHKRFVNVLRFYFKKYIYETIELSVFEPLFIS